MVTALLPTVWWGWVWLAPALAACVLTAALLASAYVHGRIANGESLKCLPLLGLMVLYFLWPLVGVYFLGCTLYGWCHPADPIDPTEVLHG